MRFLLDPSASSFYSSFLLLVPAIVHCSTTDAIYITLLNYNNDSALENLGNSLNEAATRSFGLLLQLPPTSSCHCALLLYHQRYIRLLNYNIVQLGNKEWFDKEQIGIKEPYPMTNLPFTS